ncbi:MAG: hypothetical protein NZ988_01185 [Thaumarchaeota archaeon]|nr:hypothetical protein [Candidatus Calditenuaceae archaeon]MDW8186647.1 hypothetical protein [Nitrososphaerota archaeon]
MDQYMSHIADRRLRALGLEPAFGVESNPLKWLAVQVDVPELTNFFEARYVRYQVGLRRSDLGGI